MINMYNIYIHIIYIYIISYHNLQSGSPVFLLIGLIVAAPQLLGLAPDSTWMQRSSQVAPVR